MTLPKNAKKITNPEKLLSITAWEWLTYKPSLTTRLREFTNNKIGFHLIHEGWEKVDHKETWVRCTEWRLENDCWIEAKLLIPKSSIQPDTECLLASQERPIGEQLFKEPSLTRSDFEFFQTSDTPKLWIRQSVFEFKNQPLSLIETFHPAFFKAIKA